MSSRPSQRGSIPFVEPLGHGATRPLSRFSVGQPHREHPRGIGRRFVPVLRISRVHLVTGLHTSGVGQPRPGNQQIVRIRMVQRRVQEGRLASR